MHSIRAFHFGIALAIVGALSVVLLSVMSSFFGWGTEAVVFIGTLYRGYEATVQGTLLGVLWAFVDCFIAGYVFAWLYNWMQSR